MDSHDNLHSGMQMDDKPVYTSLEHGSIADLIAKKKAMGIVRDSVKFTKIMAHGFSHDRAPAMTQNIDFHESHKFEIVFTVSNFNVYFFSYPFHLKLFFLALINFRHLMLFIALFITLSAFTLFFSPSF